MYKLINLLGLREGNTFGIMFTLLVYEMLWLKSSDYSPKHTLLPSLNVE